MRRRTLAASAAITVMLLGSFAATPMAQAEDNPCDPANGRYTCDGSEDQPDGDTRPYWEHWNRPKLPNTGVTLVSR